MPEPLSALLMTRVWSVESCLRALLCVGVRFGVTFKGCIALISVLILFRYSSIAGEAVGGSQVLFFLNGCGSVGGRFLKKCLSLLFLLNLLRDSDSCVCDEVRLGTKVKPKARTSDCGELRVLDERLVIYLPLLSSFFVSFFACLWAVLLAPLFMYLCEL